MKKIFSLLLVMCLVFNMAVYADTGNDVIEGGLADGIYEKIDEGRNNMNSDDFLKILIKSGIEFEVIDYYYTVINSTQEMLRFDSTQETNINLANESNYQLVATIHSKNKIPEVLDLSIKSNTLIDAGIPSVGANLTTSDIKMREVTYLGSKRIVGKKTLLYKNVTSTLIVSIAGIFHPIPSIIAGAMLSMGQSENAEPLDKIEVTTSNRTFHRDTWFEVLDNGRAYPTLITEILSTNVQYVITYNDHVTGSSHGASPIDIMDVKTQFSSRHNKLTLNLNDALQRYQMGWGLIVYRYNSGVQINDFSGIN